MSDTAILIIFAGVIALGIVVWLLYLAAGLVLLFTTFVMQLPIIVAILMFILFPPTLIIFLTGLAFIQFGVAEAAVPSDSELLGSRPQDIASSTDNRSPGNNNVKPDKDVKPLKTPWLTKIPDGLAGQDWLAKYAKDRELTETLTAGPRVVVASFETFKRGEIVHLSGIGGKTCYLNGAVAVAKSIVAENTRPVDEFEIKPHLENA